MKIAALITAVALASGTAFAAQDTTTSSADTKAKTSQSTTAAADQPTTKGEGLVAKTKRALHRMGDKMRSASHRAGGKDDKVAGRDTFAMGAPASDSQDSARQGRMDQAYADWKSKQK